MESRRAVVNCECGLHARPASQVVTTAMQFTSNIFIKKNDKTANAKSIMGVLSIGASNGDEVEITAEGKDEQEAVCVLKQMLEEQLVKQ